MGRPPATERARKRAHLQRRRAAVAEWHLRDLLSFHECAERWVAQNPNDKLSKSQAARDFDAWLKTTDPPEGRAELRQTRVRQIEAMYRSLAHDSRTARDSAEAIARGRKGAALDRSDAISRALQRAAQADRVALRALQELSKLQGLYAPDLALVIPADPTDLKELLAEVRTGAPRLWGDDADDIPDAD